MADFGLGLEDNHFCLFYDEVIQMCLVMFTERKEEKVQRFLDQRTSQLTWLVT